MNDHPPWKRLRSTDYEQSSAAQPATATSVDVLHEMKDCILSANPQSFERWRANNPQFARKTLSGLIGHIQSAIRHGFESSAEQPVQQGIPFIILIGWLLFKVQKQNVSVEGARDILFEMVHDEHRLFRITKMAHDISQTNEASMPPEMRIDKVIIEECMDLCATEADNIKNTLKLFCKGSD